MKDKNHKHQLRRHNYKTTGSAIFYCIQPDCNYKVGVELSLGKLTLCNRCGNETRIDEYSIRTVRPTCPKCRKRKVSDANLMDRRVIARRENDPEPRPILAEEMVNDLQERLRVITMPIEDIDSENDL